MHKPSLSNLKTKIKTHAPTIAFTAAVTACAVVTVAALRQKLDSSPSPNAREDVGEILVLEHSGQEDVYMDLDCPGMYYEVKML